MLLGGRTAISRYYKIICSLLAPDLTVGTLSWDFSKLDLERGNGISFSGYRYEDQSRIRQVKARLLASSVSRMFEQLL